MDTNLSAKMDLFSDLISCGQPLCYWELDPSLQIIRTNCENALLFHAFFLMDDPKQLIRESVQQGPAKTLIFSNSIGMSWIGTAEVVEGALCRLYLIGPAFQSDISYITLEKALSQKKYPRDVIRQFMEHVRELPIVTLDLWMRYGLMLHYCVTGERLEISDLQHLHKAPTVQASYTDDLPSPKDSTLYAEQMAIKMVEEGRIDYQKARENLSIIGGTEVHASHPSVRKFKNYLVAFNGLVVRAAIRGGLDAQTAYHLGEIYLDAIEAAENVPALVQVSRTMYDDFIQRVHKARTASGISPAVQACCNYIQMHLSEKLTMQTLASQVGYAEYYLAQKFKKEMGMTVAQYIKGRRVEQGKLMLKASNQSIADIADSLGFCSSSHFSEAFRASTGMTPVEYRESIQ